MPTPSGQSPLAGRLRASTDSDDLFDDSVTEGLMPDGRCSLCGAPPSLGNACKLATLALLFGGAAFFVFWQDHLRDLAEDAQPQVAGIRRQLPQEVERQTLLAAPKERKPAVAKLRRQTDEALAAVVTTKAPDGVLKANVSHLDRCGLIEDDVDYWTWKPIGEFGSIVSAANCQQKCEEGVPDCCAWTWGKSRGIKGLSDVCFLKGCNQGQLPQKHRSRGIVSGLSCRSRHRQALVAMEGGPANASLRNSSLSWRTNTSVALDSADSTTLAGEGRPLPTLFCFALMMPGSSEEELLKLQIQRRASIFACDGSSVYSSKVVKLGHRTASKVVDSDLNCSYGGEFKTALNLEIFMAVWVRVLADGDFRSFDWTVKADPDSVFFADRLREVVRPYIDGPSGVYLNNCRFGLHGPLEVFSRNAVDAWTKGSDHCVRHFNRLCSGDCWWGEDLFIDQCLWKVLNVTRETVDDLLVEDHCDPPEGWQSCRDHRPVAFHPFKTSKGYVQCLENAVEAERVRAESTVI